MRLPIRVFWLFSRNINRVAAANDARALSVAVSAQAGGEGAVKAHERLVIEVGDVFEIDRAVEQFDREAFEQVRSMALMM